MQFSLTEKSKSYQWKGVPIFHIQFVHLDYTWRLSFPIQWINLGLDCTTLDDKGDSRKWTHVHANQFLAQKSWHQPRLLPDMPVFVAQECFFFPIILSSWQKEWAANVIEKYNANKIKSSEATFVCTRPKKLCISISSTTASLSETEFQKEFVLSNWSCSSETYTIVSGPFCFPKRSVFKTKPIFPHLLGVFLCHVSNAI